MSVIPRGIPGAPETPEHDKLAKYGDLPGHILEFIEWLDSTDLVIGRQGVSGDITTYGVSANRLVYEFLKINQVKLDLETKAILDWWHSPEAAELMRKAVED